MEILNNDRLTYSVCPARESLFYASWVDKSRCKERNLYKVVVGTKKEAPLAPFCDEDYRCA